MEITSHLYCTHNQHDFTRVWRVKINVSCYTIKLWFLTFDPLLKHLRLRNDLYCVEWGVKLYSLTHSVETCMVRERLWTLRHNIAHDAGPQLYWFGCDNTCLTVNGNRARPLKHIAVKFTASSRVYLRKDNTASSLQWILWRLNTATRQDTQSSCFFG